jgi:hypothetical protein
VGIRPGAFANITEACLLAALSPRRATAQHITINGWFSPAQTWSGPITRAILHLISPSGSVFGPGATVNVSASFHTLTADYTRSDGAEGASESLSQAPHERTNPELGRCYSKNDSETHDYVK